MEGKQTKEWEGTEEEEKKEMGIRKREKKTKKNKLGGSCK